jgi:hypothetical protein
MSATRLGLVDQSQKMTVAAIQMADMKVWARIDGQIGAS